MKYIILSHEMIPALMWSTLEDAGLLVFDVYGNPDPNFECEDCDIPNLNNVSLEDRFVAVIFAMDDARVDSCLWSHELFNKNVFEIEDYRQALEDFLKNEYDWDGLAKTSGYLPYRNNYSGFQYLYIANIKTKIQNTNICLSQENVYVIIKEHPDIRHFAYRSDTIQHDQYHITLSLDLQIKPALLVKLRF